MVLKSLSRKSGTSQLLNYLFKKEGKLVGDKQKPILIRHNVRSRTLDKWVKEFNHNESFRLYKRKDNVKVYHTILSFSNKDKELINEKMLRDIAKQYMKLRGENNLFIGTAHYDKDHIHLHMVMSGTKYLTGEANRLSRAEFHQLKLSLDSFQKRKYPELVHSLPRHGRSKELKMPKNALHVAGRASQKETLLKCLEEAYTSSKSLEAFLAKLKTQGHEPYYRASRLTGIKFEGDRKFRLNRLGYDKGKMTRLDTLQKEEKELSDLRELRESHTAGREQDDERSSQIADREIEEDEKVENSQISDDDIEDETDDSNDVEDIGIS